MLERVFADCRLPLQMSVSATTRPPRPGEINGVHYWFLTPAEFSARQEKGEFLESFEVFGGGHWYGTLRETVSTGLQAGKWVVLEIDVQGAAEVCRAFPDAITLFVHPGSLTELERRLRGRKTETEAAICDRLETARREVATSHWYQHTIVNDSLADCAAAICSILEDHDRNP